ncbi:hypothetical protein MHPYR_640031 [uncultured Mycobacterium sp.]|uniref:Uncharacterized protein n=1 Tax=uncultured Mycobacterium sp. TaxID=171292 RepID=A0A1Y5NY05_9MYCO|nr:hypothetical protein MHPYR_100174 [uncultured Mycobacterium sp.]SBS78928.1 hypothetical protein MHPYR_640031 [uncultured Mycobacterium sp.]
MNDDYTRELHELRQIELPQGAVISRELVSSIEAVEADIQDQPEAQRDMARASAVQVLNARAIMRLELQFLEYKSDLQRKADFADLQYRSAGGR